MSKFGEYIMWGVIAIILFIFLAILYFLLPSIDRNKYNYDERICFSNCEYTINDNNLYGNDEILLNDVVSYKDFYFRHKVYIKYSLDNKEKYAILNYSKNVIFKFDNLNEMSVKDYKIFKNSKFKEVKK